MDESRPNCVKPKEPGEIMTNNDKYKGRVHCAGGEVPAGLMDRRKQP